MGPSGSYPSRRAVVELFNGFAKRRPILGFQTGCPTLSSPPILFSLANKVPGRRLLLEPNLPPERMKPRARFRANGSTVSEGCDNPIRALLDPMPPERLFWWSERSLRLGGFGPATSLV